MAPSALHTVGPALDLAGTVSAGEAPGRCLCEVAGAARPGDDRASPLCAVEALERLRRRIRQPIARSAIAPPRAAPPRTGDPAAHRRGACFDRGVRAVMAPVPRQAGSSAWAVPLVSFECRAGRFLTRRRRRIRVAFSRCWSDWSVWSVLESGGTRELRNFARGLTAGHCAHERPGGSYLDLPADRVAQITFVPDPYVLVFCPN